jgi:hypothetical protein
MTHSARLLPTLGAALCALALSSTPAQAQLARAFPLRASSETPVLGLRTFEPDAAAIAALESAQLVRLNGVPLVDGRSVELELARLDLARFDFGFRVDGRAEPELLDGLELSIWTGRVVGEPASDVLLSFSNVGVRGWIASAGATSHLLAVAGEGGDWTRARAVLASDTELEQRDLEQDFRCGTPASPTPAPSANQGSSSGARGGASTTPVGACAAFECRIALETDFQLHQVFNNNLGAQSAYVATLLAAASARYQEQISTTLTFPYVQFYTNSNDPWTVPDLGTGTGALLDEFAAAWQGNIPADAVLGHFLSGASLGGGIAYLDVLCETSETFAFGVSAEIDGDTPFPIAVGPLNWDFMVLTHELGHNFGSPHTHDFVPAIDECAFGNCITNGTIMSYCHLCPGGMNNITTFFHPQSVALMSAAAQNCLPLVEGIELAHATAFGPGIEPPVTATILGGVIGTPQLLWRYSPLAAFQAIPMSNLGGGQYAATLPTTQCGHEPEFFVQYTTTNCGAQSSDVQSPPVGVLVSVFQDAFESAQGWTAGVAGDTATSGIWTRVDPVGTAAQPEDDHTVLGTQCFVTGQHTSGGVGANDVDGGRTTLLSPVIDLSSGDAVISYERWFHNSAGANPSVEVFRVEISNDNGTNWTLVEQVGPTGTQSSGGWQSHSFQVSSFVTPTSTVRMRFIAKDDVGAVVEAGLDDFRVWRLDCFFCQPSIGSAGPGTLSLSMCGDALVTGGHANLVAAQALPGTPVFFAAALSSNPVALLGGTIVPSNYFAVVAKLSNGSGQASIQNLPGGAIAPFTVYIQAVALDASLPQDFEISNALAAQYLP